METHQLFKYCPVCKHDLTHKDRLFTCASCNFHYYVNPTPCSAAILHNKQGEILMVKRKFDPHKGMWDLPGGFVEFDETMENSVIREIKEEINAEIENLQYVCTTNDLYVYRGVLYHTICSTYTADLVDDNLKPLDDVEEIRFFKTDSIPYTDISFDSIKEILRNYLKK